MANMMRRREPRELSSAMGPFRGLVDWDPFSLLREMMRWDPLGEIESASGPGLSFLPRAEIREKEDSYQISVEVPGVKEHDIEVSCAGNRLTISGKTEEETRDEGDRFIAYERSYGRFSRSFTLPEGADIDNVKAALRDGLLHVTVPKKPGVQAKRIPVEGTQPASGQRETVERPVKVDKAA